MMTVHYVHAYRHKFCLPKVTLVTQILYTDVQTVLGGHTMNKTVLALSHWLRTNFLTAVFRRFYESTEDAPHQ